MAPSRSITSCPHHSCGYEVASTLQEAACVSTASRSHCTKGRCTGSPVSPTGSGSALARQPSSAPSELRAKHSWQDSSLQRGLGELPKMARIKTQCSFLTVHVTLLPLRLLKRPTQPLLLAECHGCQPVCLGLCSSLCDWPGLLCGRAHGPRAGERLSGERPPAGSVAAHSPRSVRWQEPCPARGRPAGLLLLQLPQAGPLQDSSSPEASLGPANVRIRSVILHGPGAKPSRDHKPVPQLPAGSSAKWGADPSRPTGCRCGVEPWAPACL